MAGIIKLYLLGRKLLQFIDRCEEMGHPCEYKLIELVANSILKILDSPFYSENRIL
jgi:hypothetical protein